MTSNKSALPVEDSTDEEEQSKEETPSSNTQNEETNSQASSEKNEDTSERISTSQIIEIEDPIMELIDLTDELEDKRDAKRGNYIISDTLNSFNPL